MSAPHVITLYGARGVGFRWTRRAGNHRVVGAATEDYASKQGAVKNMITANADIEDCVIRDVTGLASPRSRAARTDLSRGPLGGAA